MVHKEPSLRGKTKEAKDKRKEFFRKVYRFLGTEDTVQAADQEVINGRWYPVRGKWIGIQVTEKYRGTFRRRSSGFIPLEEDK